MKLEQVTKSIIHLEYKNQVEAASALLRFQEYYESPHFKGKVFTRGEFHRWYSEEYGAATYVRDWGGFNFPGYVIEPFFKGLFDPLTNFESEIVELFRYRTDKFYLIGTSQESSDDTFNHEVCHGLYYTCDGYRHEVNSHLASYDLKALHRHLQKIGYCDEVLDDESHAYISASGDYLTKNDISFDKGLQKSLQSLFKQYLKREK